MATLAQALAGGPGCPPLAGSTLGPWVAEAELGRGGMGVVVRARHRERGQRVALKVLLLGHAASDTERQRFEREARLGAALSHRAVVRLVESGHEDGLPYIAFELVEGRTLAAALQDGPLSVAEALRVVREVASGVAAAHARGIVHRDLKPQNVLLRAADGQPLVSDFGLARDLEAASSLTRTGVGVGTPAYLAPEQVKGQPATPATDVFALGELLYQCLTGALPFDGPTPTARHAQVLAGRVRPPGALRAEVPGTLDAVCLRCLRPHPPDRYRDAGALVEALAALDGGAPRRSRAWAIGAAGVALVLALAGAVALAARPDAPPAVAPPAPAPVVVATPERPAPATDATGPRLEALLEGQRPWRRVGADDGGPGARDGAERAMSFAASRRQALLFAGWDGKTPADDLWAWDGAAWQPLPPTGRRARRPPARFAHVAVWDEARARLVVFGGAGPLDDTWEWDGERWRQAEALTRPEGRAWAAGAFDPVRGRVLVFGGSGERALNDLWAWDGTRWRPEPAATRPPPRHAHAMCWEAARQRLVVFGGADVRRHGDTWAWDPQGGWRELRGEGPTPEPRHAASLVDGPRGPLLFGGAGERSGLLDDLWLLEGERWTRLDPPLRPAPRCWHAAAWDAHRGVLVVSGGMGQGDARLFDLWEWGR